MTAVEPGERDDGSSGRLVGSHHADALSWGARVSGVTIHLVDEQVDHGPIVLQEAVPVLEGDDEATLHGRIQEAEHRLYPKAVRMMVEGRLQIEGRQVRVMGEFEAAR